MSLYNTLTRSQDPFTSAKPNAVGMYVCGPTVYGRASIGNLRSYVFADTLRRLFEADGYKVTHVMNITDVGHLTDDASEGDDKMEVAAKKTGETAWDIAKKYTDLFVQDLGKLNIQLPHVMPRATDHIAEQIAMIQAIEEKGMAYRISDGIYFDTAKLPSYGQLSRQPLSEKEEGARIGVNEEKKNPTDFALWKFSSEGEKRQMEWESPWGVGFPGWHIECSAMGEKYLGVPFDIHTGGIDHIAVHHENELAQTDAARGCLEANVWMHNEFLLVDGGKMSKSLGNTYSVDDLTEKGISPRAFRLFLLGAHYRSHLNFTFDAAQAAQNAINNLIDDVRDWAKPSDLHADEASMSAFMDRIRDDLDTAGALAVFWGVVHNDAMPSGVKSATVLKMDEVLGLALEDVVARPIKITEEAQKLLDDRARARAAKEWQRSDELRDQLAELGYAVEDTAKGQRVRENR
ncbi:cysteine--tRNA ligase [bacterium]|nr:cysteine--tRNA ligase [bacterium]